MNANEWKSGDEISTDLILLEPVEGGTKVKGDDGYESTIDNIRGFFWWAYVKGTDPKHRFLIHTEHCSKKPEVQKHFAVPNPDPKNWLSSSNPPAFPCDLNIGQPGMQLRDYFAAQALTGYLALTGLLVQSVGVKNIKADAATTAKECYAYADAMIEARKQA